MNCPECDGKTGVKDSRQIEMNVYRRRVCKGCGYKFYTEETEIEDTSGFRYYWANAQSEYRKGKKNVHKAM